MALEYSALARPAGPCAPIVWWRFVDPESNSPTPHDIPNAVAAELTGNYIRGKRLSIVELSTPGNSVVKGKIFEECDLYGPAVVMMTGHGETGWCRFSFPADPDDMLFEIQPTRRYIVGVVVFQDCIFRRCSFFDVGLAGTRQDLIALKASLSPENAA